MKINKHIRKAWGNLAYRWINIILSISDGKHKINLGEIHTDYSSEDQADASLFFYTAADAAYFDLYGTTFINSIYANTSQTAIHVHLFNPAEHQLDWLSSFRQCTEKGFSYSWEYVDLSSLSAEQKGRFYYTTRFYRLYDTFLQFGIPCMCLDIDSLVVKNIEHIAEGLEERNIDVAFYERFGKWGSNTKLLAGTLYVRPTPGAQSFLRDVSQQIRRFVENSFLIEKIDQIVLYDFYKKYMKEKRLKFEALGYPTIDLNFTENGIIWYPKGSTKNDCAYLQKRKEFLFKETSEHHD